MDRTTKVAKTQYSTPFRGKYAYLHLYESLATLLDGGVTLSDALAKLAETSSEFPTLRRFCTEAFEQIGAGQSLSNVLQQYPFGFSAWVVRAVRSGEITGQLGDVFAELAENERRQIQDRDQLRAALTYPGMILLGTIALLVAPSLIFGDIEAFFSELGLTLPGYVLLIFRISKFASSAWLWILLLAIAFGVHKYYTENQSQHSFMRTLRLFWSKVPGFSHLVTISSNLYICRSLSTLLNAGIPVTSAIGYVFDVKGDPIMQAAKDSIITDLSAGESIADSLKYSGLILPLPLALIAVGESTGRLPEMLEKSAELLDLNLKTDTKTLLELIQPILLGISGGIVGLLAIGILKPISELINI